MKNLKYFFTVAIIWLILAFPASAINQVVGNWTFGEGTGTNASDQSGFGNHGTTTGAAWATTLNNGSVNGSALVFNTSSLVNVSISTSASLNTTNAITLSVWVKPNNDYSDLNVKDLIIKTSAYRVYSYRGQIFFYTDGADVFSTPTLTWVPGWYYIQVTYDNNTGVGNIYRNGALQATTTSTGKLRQNADNLVIGSAANATIDEVKIYNYVLNSSELTTEYQQYQPVPAYPVGGITIAGTFPPLTSTVNYTWQDTIYPSDELIIAKDQNYNIIVSDTTTSLDYANIVLENGFTYYWKVRQYNSGVYGATSATQTFTLSTTSATHSSTAIEGIVYELISGAQTPISNAKVLIYNNTWSSSVIVGSNGYYLFDNLANQSTYSIQATKQDYDTGTIETVTTGNFSWTTKNLLLQLTNPTFWESNKHYVTFVVQNLWGTRYPGVLVTTYEGSSASAKHNGSTQVDGTITYLMNKNQQYRVTFINSSLGINGEINIFPVEATYYYITSASTTNWWQNTTNSEVQQINITVNTSTVNATYAFVNVSYVDAMAQTSGLMFYLNQSNATNPANQTSLQSFNGGSSSSVSHAFSVHPYKGTSYLVNVKATHATFRAISRSYGVRFPGLGAEIENEAIDPAILGLLAIGVLVFLGAMFGQTSREQGAGMVVVVAWIFYGIGITSGIGWVKDSAGVPLGLVFATIIAVMANMAKREREDGV